MFRKQSSLLVLCLLCLAAALASKVSRVPKVPKVSKLHFSIKPNAHIVELQSESRELAATHADVSSACFYVYKPLLESVAAEYETSYGACVTAYDQSSSVINAKYNPVRDDLVVTTTLACNACCKVWQPEADTDLNTLVKRVQCSAQVSADNSKILYTVSANATENAVKIQEEYRVVGSQRDICVNNAERNYVQDTSSTYEQLNACLKGQAVPTPGTPSTTPGGDIPQPPTFPPTDGTTWTDDAYTTRS